MYLIVLIIVITCISNGKAKVIIFFHVSTKCLPQCTLKLYSKFYCSAGSGCIKKCVARINISKLSYAMCMGLTNNSWHTDLSESNAKPTILHFTG